jgi:DNA-directed RNA polymerase subunit M/transcription elongation factor TFIIS
MPPVTTVQREARMIEMKTCPKCGSGEYMFRGRKKVEAEEGKPKAVETKYKCKACGHEWRVKSPAVQ